MPPSMCRPPRGGSSRPPLGRKFVCVLASVCAGHRGGGARGAPAGQRRYGSGGARGLPGRGRTGDLTGARHCGVRQPAAGDLTDRGGPRDVAGCACGGGARLQGRGGDGGDRAHRPPAGAGRGAPAEALIERGPGGEVVRAALSGWVGGTTWGLGLRLSKWAERMGLLASPRATD
jgi:hypothetical protein